MRGASCTALQAMISDNPTDETVRPLPLQAKTPSLYPPGGRVDQYIILQSLAKGGMGAVYAAHDTELDRRVALKFLLPQHPDSVDPEEGQSRLLLEARAMARLSHPNVVTLYQVGQAPGGGIYLAMELVSGGTLADWLKAQARTWRETLTLLCAAGEGLAAAHKAGLIHRDFKMANVLVRQDGRPQVTDFGVVRAAADKSQAEITETLPPEHSSRKVLVKDARAPSQPVRPNALSVHSEHNPTLTGAILGTPGYMAPEQYLFDGDIDARADIFAFSATLYRALFGQRPFAGEGIDVIATATINGAVRPFPEGSPVPAWVRKAVLWGLQTERDARPASMEVLLAALRNDPVRRRRRWIASLLFIAGMLLVGGGVRALGQRRVRECRAVAERLSGVWDSDQKEAIAKAFRATGVVYAEDTWRRVAEHLDARASAIAGTAYDACAATRIRGEQSLAMMTLRNECLDERVDEFRATTNTFKDADAKGVENAVKLVNSLHSVDLCSNLDRLGAATRLPSDPQARTRVRELQASLAEARALYVSGKLSLVEKRLEEVQDAVRLSGYGPLLVAFSMTRARVTKTRNAETGLEGWREALELADQYHLDPERAEIEVELGSVYDDVGQHDAARFFLTLAGATITRIGGDPRLELFRAARAGYNAYAEGKYAEVVRVLEPALARAEAAHVTEQSSFATAHTFLGVALSKDEERLADAVLHAKEAILADERAFGPDHPSVAAMVNNHAQIAAFAGRYDEAIESNSRSLTKLRGAVARGEIPPSYFSLGNALSTRGLLLLRLGRGGQAYESLEESRRIATQAKRPDLLMEASTTLVSVLHLLGRDADARVVDTEAQALVEKNKETSPDLVSRLCRVEAEMLLDAKKGKEALPLAERAVKLAEAGGTDLYDSATARFVLAKALLERHADAHRAHDLLEKARSGFAKLRDEGRVLEVTALLSSDAGGAAKP